MLVDDSPLYPMSFHVRARLQNRIEPNLLAEALSASLLRHPLLSCRVEYRRGQPCWIQAPHNATPLWLIGATDPLWQPGGEYINLQKETGLRVWIRFHGDDTELILQFHHACCDGIGAIQFFGDVAVAYALRTCPETVRTRGPIVEPERLLSRHQSMHRRPVIKSTGMLSGMRSALRECIKHVRQKPVPLAVVDRKHVAGDKSEPRIETCHLDRRTTQGLRDAARKVGFEVNDILLRDLLLTLDEWNKQHQPDERGHNLRILMPTCLRAKGDKWLPAANLIGYAFITRQSRDLADPDALLKSIARDTLAIKRYRLGWLWLDTLVMLQRIRILQMMTRRLKKRCQATAVHSNLGNAFGHFESRFTKSGEFAQIGNLLLTQIAWVPPIRNLTHVAIGTHSERGKLSVNLRCDPHKYSTEHAQILLQRYVDRLTRTAGLGNNLS